MNVNDVLSSIKKEVTCNYVEAERILRSLEPLFEEAKRDDKYFYHPQLQLTLMPYDLLSWLKKGFHLWDSTHWRLVSRRSDCVH